MASLGTNPVDFKATLAYAGVALPVVELLLPVLGAVVAPVVPVVFFRARLAYAGVAGLSALLRHTESSPPLPPALLRATLANAGGALPEAAAVAPALFKATFAYAGGSLSLFAGWLVVASRELLVEEVREAPVVFRATLAKAGDADAEDGLLLVEVVAAPGEGFK